MDEGQGNLKQELGKGRTYGNNKWLTICRSGTDVPPLARLRQTNRPPLGLTVPVCPCADAPFQPVGQGRGMRGSDPRNSAPPVHAARSPALPGPFITPAWSGDQAAAFGGF
jgi:hypothetical protein